VIKITLLPGDGVGPEVLEQAMLVLDAVKRKYSLEYTISEGMIGGQAIDATGKPFPQETQQKVQASDIVILGSVGGPQWDALPPEIRPEKGLLELRKSSGLYANLRPVKCWPQLLQQSPLKNHIVEGVDILIVRELIGGAYFGKKATNNEGDRTLAFDTIEYNDLEIRRIIKKAMDVAGTRRNKVTSVDKANVLETSRLWRKVAEEEIVNYPKIELNHLYVDNCAMQLCLNPAQFDVIVTENMFGDILSDQASVLGASLGMLPSASLGDGIALYEPIHGSAPDIAGQDKANPLAAILSIAMMLNISFQHHKAAEDVEKAVDNVLIAGLRTADIWTEGFCLVGTHEMGKAIAEQIK
jgi:3-isopropylmalate dehydrogenase